MTRSQMKQFIRRIEARLTPRKRAQYYDGHRIQLTRSMWWDESSPEFMASDIEPYFAQLAPSFNPKVVLDAGASSGAFCVAAALRFRQAQFYAFEPSRRNRILLRRNVRRNSVAERVKVEALGLWDERSVLAFHTHGGMSALQSVAAYGGHRAIVFDERIEVVPLDESVRERGVSRIDLLKMDIEGAELEALEGARVSLGRLRPQVLVQAYHLRDGSRTFERRADLLAALGYDVVEPQPYPGLLHGIAR